MKAILVIDMPKYCNECDLERYAYCESKCSITNMFTRDYRKPDWCPLKPMPKKKYKAVEEFSRAVYCYQGIKEAGWNECIDEILGVSEDESN